jgi:hypothetical protein
MMGLTLAAALALTPPPRTALGWSRSDSPRFVAPADIFSYMDGAGELYLAYGLVRLDVHEYTSPTEPPITLEVYTLRSADDAYGLLSLDWDGEPVALDSAWPAAPPRALYGSGLLRAWSGDVYVRVMATNETPAARATVLEIGRALLAGRASAPPPGIVAAMPATLGTGHVLRADRVAFLRSHLVLNSIYFLGTANLLGLGPETEAVAASYDRRETGGRLRVLMVHYPSEAAARDALVQFGRSYLHGAPSSEGTTTERVEDGWLGCRRHGRRLALVFEADTRATAAAITEELSR